MAVYQVANIIKDVRIALDQNAVSDALTGIEDVDTLSLNEIIRSKIVEAVRRVHCEAPSSLLDGGNNFGDSICWEDLESGWILLPENFMRLVVFEMSDWDMPVFTAIGADEPRYAMQKSRFKGIRGTAQKPFCAISIRPEGRVLEFYSCKSENATVSRAVYMPYPVIDKYGGIDVSSSCYDAVLYKASALVAMALGEVEKSAVFSDLSKSILK